jgi:hypothetical protein
MSSLCLNQCLILLDKKNAWYITTTSTLYVAKPVPIPSKVKKALCSQGKFILSPGIVAAKPVPFGDGLAAPDCGWEKLPARCWRCGVCG